MHCCLNVYRLYPQIMIRKRATILAGISIAIVMLVISSSVICRTIAIRPVGKSLVIPISFPTSVDYLFIHIIRDQECTKCSVSSLYHWNEIISMIGRTDISYLFIIETMPEDTPDTIMEALKRRPFSQPLFIDYSQEFLENNPWLTIKRYRDNNDFIINKSGKIIYIGDPLNNYNDMIKIKKIR